MLNDTLKRLEGLELDSYAGNLEALQKDREEYVGLTEQPVEVKIVGAPGVCEAWLYNICSGAEGQYERFIELRERVQGELLKFAKGPGWNLLTVGFTGIYVGEPEDLHNLRNGGNILYQTRGLGRKMADVTFLETSNVF